ncbi:MAG: DsbA family oxidoreductase [Gammaproteobacteria bacterium]|nr:DsbA family oxidoreductase [Gammaproteobacteria bacterium]
MLPVNSIQVDIVSDVVCPWCYVGYKQLLQAAKALDIELTVSWRPFQLNPNMAQEGQNLREHLIEKYGISEQDSVNARERLKNVGEELGINFNFTDDSRIYNTMDAHKLLAFASELDKQNELKQALFNAYFTEQKNISDRLVLMDITKHLGLDVDDIEQALNSDQLKQLVTREIQSFQAQGITGVPAMIFKQKYLVTGAQGIDNYKNILTQLVAENN